MTREELMTHARSEVDKAFEGKRNRMMNLVEQAWAEGKRNAEADALAEAIEAALDKLFTRQLPKRGRWESYMIDARGYSNVFRCTSCSQITQMSMYMKECEYDFCPHCGAKMDGGET